MNPPVYSATHVGVIVTTILQQLAGAGLVLSRFQHGAEPIELHVDELRRAADTIARNILQKLELQADEHAETLTKQLRVAHALSNEREALKDAKIAELRLECGQLREKLRDAEIVRDDARAASARDLERRRDAEQQRDTLAALLKLATAAAPTAARCANHDLRDCPQCGAYATIGAPGAPTVGEVVQPNVVDAFAQLTADAVTYVPTARDGAIIGDTLAERLAQAELIGGPGWQKGVTDCLDVLLAYKHNTARAGLQQPELTEAINLLNNLFARDAKP